MRSGSRARLGRWSAGKMPHQARQAPAGQPKGIAAQRQAASAILNRDHVPSPMTPAKIRAKRAGANPSGDQIINHSACPVKLFPMEHKEHNEENIHPQVQDRESNYSMYSRQSTVLGSARASSFESSRANSFAAASSEGSRFMVSTALPTLTSTICKLRAPCSEASSLLCCRLQFLICRFKMLRHHLWTQASPCWRLWRRTRRRRRWSRRS